jgi:hypothetical protein
MKFKVKGTYSGDESSCDYKTFKEYIDINDSYELEEYRYMKTLKIGESTHVAQFHVTREE